MAAEPQPVHCATHPQVETYLRCGRCDKPICPRCLVQTPVGTRCRDCARLRPPPTYDVKPAFLLRGAAAALAAALLGGVVLLFILGSFRFLGLIGTLLLGALYGYLVAEAISRATNHKRGPRLIWTALAALFVGFSLARAALILLQAAPRGPLEPAATLLRALTIGFTPDLVLLLLLVPAAAVAYNRLR